MVWWTQPKQLADKNGEGTGRWRMVATSDEGGGQYADTSHDHASAEEAEECDKCDEYCSGATGFPSRKKQAEQNEARERKELARLKEKYGDI